MSTPGQMPDPNDPNEKGRDPNDPQKRADRSDGGGSAGNDGETIRKNEKRAVPTSAAEGTWMNPVTEGAGQY